MKATFITSIDQIDRISQDEKAKISPITDRFAFRSNDYYLNLIDWNNPNDPIRRIIIPNEGELLEYGQWDASDEETNYVVPGCQHKYTTTALLVISEVCGGYCRFCFRKRLFVNHAKEATVNPQLGLEYIHQHNEINNVLLTGGDSLMLSTNKLRLIIEQLREIEHVKIIRLGSKLPVYNPMRIYEDEELLDLLRTYSFSDRRIYLMAHVNHPNELTAESIRAFTALTKAGVITQNQTPILKGINDDPAVLADLLDKLIYMGVSPYYFFINRPVAGNSDFVLPLEKAYKIVELAKARTSGLGKRVRLVMSHSSGKIEILAIENGEAYLKYHQSRDGNYGQVMILDCPKDASWFDDLPGNEAYWRKHEDIILTTNEEGL